MRTETRTKQRRNPDLAPSKDPLFGKLPDQYYGYALQWSEYPRWTIEETANLLTGCVPHREMFLKGAAHQALDAEVLANENKIRTALGKGLTVVESKRYFAKTYIDSSNIIEWAKSESITIPNDLIKAFAESRRRREMHGYMTPAMEAIDWVVATFWEHADLRDPPKEGEIVQALLQKFPNLDPEDCEMVERLTRHPAAGIDE